MENTSTEPEGSSKPDNSTNGVSDSTQHSVIECIAKYSEVSEAAGVMVNATRKAIEDGWKVSGASTLALIEVDGEPRVRLLCPITRGATE